MAKNATSCTAGVTRIYRLEKDHIKVMALNLRCGRWDCPECAERKAKDIRDRLSAFMAKSKTFMYTLTFKQARAPEETWRNMPKVWNLFRTRIAQKYGKFDYIRIVETHKNTPYPHLHVVANINIPESVFGQIAVESGFGWQLYKSPCDEEAAYYVSKYLTKAWANEDSAFLRKKLRIRIVSWSRGLSALWSKPAKKPTVSVHANVALQSAESYEQLFQKEFPVAVKITHQKTYRRGHVWRIEHPMYHPFTLLQTALPNIAFAKATRIYRNIQRLLHDNEGVMCNGINIERPNGVNVSIQT